MLNQKTKSVPQTNANTYHIDEMSKESDRMLNDTASKDS